MTTVELFFATLAIVDCVALMLERRAYRRQHRAATQDDAQAATARSSAREDARDQGGATCGNTPPMEDAAPERARA